jgi:hypothetical protein
MKSTSPTGQKGKQMKAVFIKKSKVCNDGNIYQVTPPIQHEGREWNVIRVWRATPHTTGILSFSACWGAEVLGDDFKTARDKDGEILSAVRVEAKYLSFKDALAQIGYEEQV